jgi:hypothetical protein
LNFFAGGGSGCLHVTEGFFLRCRVINPCSIPCNNALQELLSLFGVTCQMHESHATRFVVFCEVFSQPACSDFSVIQLLVVDNVVRTTQRSI